MFKRILILPTELASPPACLLSALLSPLSSPVSGFSFHLLCHSSPFLPRLRSVAIFGYSKSLWTSWEFGWILARCFCLGRFGRWLRGWRSLCQPTCWRSWGRGDTRCSFQLAVYICWSALCSLTLRMIVKWWRLENWEGRPASEAGSWSRPPRSGWSSTGQSTCHSSRTHILAFANLRVNSWMSIWNMQKTDLCQGNLHCS